MTSAAIRRRTLEEAAVMVGGEEALAAHLRVTREEVAAWIAEEKIPPSSIYVAVMDLLDRSLPGDDVYQPVLKTP